MFKTLISLHQTSLSVRTSHWQQRYLSLNSAINQSLRKTKSSSVNSRVRRPRIFNGAKQQRDQKGQLSERIADSLSAPVAVPYTTSSSEFLYGQSAVKAAIRARRRRLYKLYMLDGGDDLTSEERMVMRRLALKNEVPVERIKDDRSRLMDKMSEGRPHNGYVLEASPLPKLPITGLGLVKKPNGLLPVQLGHQSREDENVNENENLIKYDASTGRYPFVIFLDGIRDTGNLGAIIRSAFLLGADALALTSHCAPLSAVTLKASAGAAELLPLLSIADPFSFLDDCKAQGWNVYAASPPDSQAFANRRILSTDQLGRPLQHSPCLLIMGSEGEGIRERIMKRAQSGITIHGQRMGQGGVDSLNVSVASALLTEAFLRPFLSDKHLAPKRGKFSKQEDGLF